MFKFIINKINLYKIKKGKITIHDLYIPKSTTIIGQCRYDRLTEEICLELINQDPFNLIDIPEEKRTYVVCLNAVKQDGYTLKYVPKDIITYGLCLEAVSKCSRLSSPLEFVPDKFKYFDVCCEALRWNWNAVSFLPKKFKTHDLLLRAIRYNPQCIELLKPRAISYKMARLAVKLDMDTIVYVPDKYLLRLIDDLDISKKILKSYNIYNKVVSLKEMKKYTP